MLLPQAQPSAWANNIVGYVPAVEIADLLANDANPWLHGAKQQEALFAVLDGVGWWDAVKVNRRTGRIVDGHARIVLALRHHQTTVPVLLLDLTEEQERIALATHNHIAKMVAVDSGSLDLLLSDIDADGLADTHALLGDVLGQLQQLVNDLPPPPPPPNVHLLPAGHAGGAFLIEVDPEDALEDAVSGFQARFTSPNELRQNLSTLAGHRAAEPHPTISAPMGYLQAQGYLREPVLDYGCGMDPHPYARFDPAYAPDYRVFRQFWNTITLNFVLNIIPLEHNRIEALMTARALMGNGTDPDAAVYLAIWNPSGPTARRHQGYQARWSVAEWERCFFRVFQHVDTLSTPNPKDWWAWRCAP